MVGGQIEQIADHLERHGEGELVDQFHLAALGGPVEHIVDQLLHPRPQPLDGGGGEALAHQAAQAGVVGWVEVEDGLGDLTSFEAFVEALATGPPDRIDRRRGVGLDVAGELGAAQGTGHIVVAGEHRESERRHVHRVVLAQRCVERVRVGPECRVEGVEDRFGHGSLMRSDEAGPLVERHPLAAQTVHGGGGVGVADRHAAEQHLVLGSAHE